MTLTFLQPQKHQKEINGYAYVLGMDYLNCLQMIMTPSALRPVIASQVFLLYLIEGLVLKMLFVIASIMTIIQYQDIAPCMKSYIHLSLTLSFEEKLHTFLVSLYNIMTSKGLCRFRRDCITWHVVHLFLVYWLLKFFT